MIKRGEIYYVDLNDTKGSEQRGERPAVILQNQQGNLHSTTTIIAPMTSFINKRLLPVHVLIQDNNIRNNSIILLEQIRVVDKIRLIEKLGELPPEIMLKVNEAIKISLGLYENMEIIYDRVFI